MRKKMYGKMTAAVLAAAMVLSMAGCGDKKGGESSAPSGSGTESSGTGQNVETEESSETGQNENTGDHEFSYFGAIWSPYQESTPIFDELMARTGIKVNFEWASGEGMDTLIASKISSQALPDVISGGTGGPTAINDLISRGLIVPITEYLDTDLANYGRLLTEEDKLFLTYQDDGEIYGFGLVMDVPGSFSTMIRTDWLERVNMEMPKTWDEWMAVWKAFKEQDANGNGDPNDEIPFGFDYNFQKLVLGIFGMNSNGEFSVSDGEYLYDPENPRYETYMDALREMYESGLLSQEMITLKGADFNTLGASNTLGSLVGYAEYSKNYTVSCRELDEGAFFQSVVPIQGPDGAQAIPARSKVQASAYITVAAVENGHLEDILKFFNYVYSDEGIELTNYGMEGEYHDVADGKPVLKAPYNEGFKTAREKGLIPSTIPFCFTEDVYMQILTGGLGYEELDDTGKTFMDGLTINEPYFYTEPPVLQTESYVECFDLREQQVSLRDRYITGEISKEEYRDGYEALKNQGLAQMIEDAKEAYRKMAQ
ncbi:MAG: extracellular solute-binding protein [Lachnospiraceae bacterium]|nr:extracellular solute-binding protein [Lachnospiraceae bacterium]